MRLCPLKLVCNRLQVWAYLYHFLNFSCDLLYDAIVFWFLFELECQDLLEHVPQGARDKLENLLGVFEIEALPQKIFELITGVLELFVKVSPGEITLIKEINHDVHETLYIISSTLIVPPATVETGKQEVATEFLSINLLNMAAIIVQVPASQTEVDQINQGRIFVSYQYVIQF